MTGTASGTTPSPRSAHPVERVVHFQRLRSAMAARASASIRAVARNRLPPRSTWWPPPGPEANAVASAVAPSPCHESMSWPARISLAEPSTDNLRLLDPALTTSIRSGVTRTSPIYVDRFSAHGDTEPLLWRSAPAHDQHDASRSAGHLADAAAMAARRGGGSHDGSDRVRLVACLRRAARTRR